MYKNIKLLGLVFAGVIAIILIFSADSFALNVIAKTAVIPMKPVVLPPGRDGLANILLETQSRKQ